MKRSRPRSVAYVIAVALGVAGAAAATGVAFAGWATHGPEMFLAMAATGLSWCF